jgi:hypothetical protein
VNLVGGFHGQEGCTHQHIDSAAHSIVFVLVSDNIAVLEQALHQFGHCFDKMLTLRNGFEKRVQSINL